MSIDFFKDCCLTSSNEAEFGLYDEAPPSSIPAYIKEDNNDAWIAIVKNDKQQSVNFYAIDNCIDLFRKDGKESKKCDGLLRFNNSLIFVELKDRSRKGSDWLKGKNKKGKPTGATEQLAITIEHFKEHYDLKSYDKIVAYACNKQKPHFNKDHKIIIDDFKERTGITLRTQRTITL